MSIDKHNHNTRSWLVMLYIAADDVDTNEIFDGSIYDECDKMLGNLGRMERNKDIHLVALFDAKQGATAGAYIKLKGTGSEDYLHDITEEVIAKGGAFAARFHGVVGERAVDTGSRETLGTFVNWAIQEYPAEYRMLSVIGHGCGWSTVTNDPAKSGGSPSGSPNRMGLCPDLTTRNAISTTDLREALEMGLLNKKESQHTLDVLFLDACLMGMFEVIYEVSDQVKYVVAGQDYLYTGLPYQRYVQGLSKHIKPEQLATSLVERYNKNDHDQGIYIRQNAWAIAAIDASAAKDLAALIDALASALISVIEFKGVRSAVEHAYLAAQKFNYDTLGAIDTYRESYIDLFDFAINLASQLSVAVEANVFDEQLAEAVGEVKECANRVANKIGERNRTSAKIESDGSTKPEAQNTRLRGDSTPHSQAEASAVILKAHTQSFASKPEYSLANAYGLSIYFPLNKEDVHLESYRDINSLKFARTSSAWGALLEMLRNKDGQAPMVSKIEETRAPRNLRLKRQQLP